MKHKPIASLPAHYAKKVAGRLYAKAVLQGSGCLVWTGAKGKTGYGKIQLMPYGDGRRRYTSAHRAAWLALVGEIPADLQIDHLCFNRACVNVAHMELVTAQENISRSNPEGGARRVGPPPVPDDRTHCIHGHPWTQENIYERVGNYGKTVRSCRTCAYNANKRARRRALLSK